MPNSDQLAQFKLRLLRPVSVTATTNETFGIATRQDSMPDVSFNNLPHRGRDRGACAACGRLLATLRVPAVVLEIVAGVIVGPSVLGWVEVDLPVQILALFGLAFLLFLAGLEIDLNRLKGRALGVAMLGYVITLALGLAAGVVFHARRDPGALRGRRADCVTALAERFGLESILGAFLAGAVVGLVDRDSASHPNFQIKLEAIGPSRCARVAPGRPGRLRTTRCRPVSESRQELTTRSCVNAGNRDGSQHA